MININDKHNGRFFARISTLDIACPNCGQIHSTIRNRKPVAGRLSKTNSWWDPYTCRFKCTNCQKTFQLGVLAYQIKSKGNKQLAEDQSPNLKQSLAIREARHRGSTGYMAASKLDLSKDHANLEVEGVDNGGMWIEFPEK